MKTVLTLAGVCLLLAGCATSSGGRGGVATIGAAILAPFKAVGAAGQSVAGKVANGPQKPQEGALYAIPYLSGDNVPNGCNGNAIFLGKPGVGVFPVFVFRSDFFYKSSGKFVVGMIFPVRVLSENIDGVNTILLVSDPFKVLDPVVGLDSIFMVHAPLSFWVGNKFFCDKPVNPNLLSVGGSEKVFGFGVLIGAHQMLRVGFWPALANGEQGSCAALKVSGCRNKIAGVTGNWTPSFI